MWAYTAPLTTFGGDVVLRRTGGRRGFEGVLGERRESVAVEWCDWCDGDGGFGHRAAATGPVGGYGSLPGWKLKWYLVITQVLWLSRVMVAVKSSMLVGRAVTVA